MKLTTYVLLFLSIINIGFAQKPEVVVQKGHTGGFGCFAFTPDGKYILSAGIAGDIKLWETSTGKEIKTYWGESTNFIIISKDGKSFFTGNGSNIINREIFTGKELKNIKKEYLQSIVFSTDRKYLFTAGFDYSVKLFDISEEKDIRSFAGHKEIVSCIAVTTDDKYLISGSFDNTIKLWDINSGAEIKSFIGHTKPVTSVSISQDASFVLSGSEDNTLKLWDIKTGKELKTFKGHTDRIVSVSISLNREFAVSGSYDKTIRVWDISSGKEIKNLNMGLSVFGGNLTDSPIRTVALSPNGKYIVAGDFWKLKIWDINTFNEVKTIKGYAIEEGYALSNDDKSVFSTGAWAFSKWDISLGKKNKAFYMPYYQLNLSLDKKFVLFAGIDSTIKVCNILTGEIVKSIPKQNGFVYSLALSPDNNFAVCGADNNMITILDLVDGKVLNSFPQRTENYNKITSLAISPDGKYVLSGSSDNSLKLWDINTGNLLNNFNEHKNYSKFVCFSPDGVYALSGGYDSTFQLWEIPSGKLLKTFTGHTNFVETACFSKDVKYVLSGSWDKTVKLWDIYTAQEIKTFTGHSEGVGWVAFSNNGKNIFSSGGDRTTKMWDMATGNEICSFISLDGNDYITVTPDNYYTCSNGGYNGVSFVINNHAFPFEQFDLQYNRPDIVLERIGLAPKEVIETYKRAYEKRLKKMNFKGDMFKEDYHIPVNEILTKDIPISSNDKNINFKLKTSDTQYKLDRLNVYVNDVPIYGANGIDLRDKSTSNYEQNINLELSNGNNKIQVSSLNEKGVESLKETFDITYNGQKKESKKYFIGIGVSNYQDSKMKLNYSVKDINDLASAFKENDANADITTLTDEKATKENILALKEKLMKTNVDDEVIISLSGHGIVSKSLDFYYGTFDMDFKNPELKGLMYDELDQLLDGIPARKKLLLIDACNSGELDKENTQITENNKLPDNVKGIDIIVTDVQQSELGLQNSFELMQEMFVNLTRGNGAVVISAAGGKQFAYEGGQWNNGVFTYCILKGLKEKAADKNSDGQITVSELKDYVSTQVEILTNGKQKPTSRRENLEFDFKVW
jgi:WD40 repeat protein